MMPLHSPVSWALVQHTVAPLTALVLLTAASVPEPPTPRVVADPAANDAADDTAGAATSPEAAVLEAEAISIAHDLRAVPADETDRLCARDDLRVSWTEPVGFEHGAHVGTIGPAPDADTVEANGVVVCGDSTWAYMGFEAQRVDGEWQVNAVPYLEEDHGDVASLNLDADPDPHGEDQHGHGQAEGHDDGRDPAAGTPARPPTPSPSAPTGSVAQSEWLAGLGPIEPYAAYEPQQSCSPTVKAGMGVVRDTLLGTHPQTRNLGVVRACHIGGRSEHKEGRAFDWGAYVSRPVEKAAVERFLTQLFATDADGNTHALARRMGVMYVVWNGQIWASYRAAEGWRHYYGPNPHVDHIHISLNWAGGLGQTSFFTRDLAGRGVLGLVPPGGAPLATDGSPVAPSPVTGQEPTSPWTPAPTTSDGTSGGTTGGTSGGTSKDAPTRSAPKDGHTKDGHTKDAPSTDGSPSAPSPSPTPAPEPDDTDADHARREAEKEQRRIEEEQRKAEEEQRRIEEEQRRLEEQQRKAEEQQRREEEKQRKAEARQAEQQAVSTQRDDTDGTTPGKGGGKGGGKGKG